MTTDAELARDCSTCLHLREQSEALATALEPFECVCTGRCESFPWLPPDNGACSRRAARAALSAYREDR